MKINSRIWLGPVNSNFHFEEDCFLKIKFRERLSNIEFRYYGIPFKTKYILFFVFVSINNNTKIFKFRLFCMICVLRLYTLNIYLLYFVLIGILFEPIIKLNDPIKDNNKQFKRWYRARIKEVNWKATNEAGLRIILRPLNNSLLSGTAERTRFLTIKWLVVDLERNEP